MNEAALTKVCPLCAETIKAAAKVCPFCQSRLSRWALWQQELGGAGLGLLLVGVALAVLAWLMPDKPGFRGRNFPPHRDDLVVQGMSLEKVGKQPEFWLSGFVSNRGRYPWRIEALEVRFLDRADRLLEAQHPRVGEPFVVQPAREVVFRVNLGRLPPAISQASVTARVYQATDGNLRPAPD